MIRQIIRFLTLIGSVAAISAAISLDNKSLYFTSLSLFVGFLGTFIKSKQEPQKFNSAVQKGGAFSHNTQTNHFSGGQEDDKK